MTSYLVCNLAADNTLCACDKDVESVAIRLEDDTSRALDCLNITKMVVNATKFQVIFLGLKQHQEFLLEIEHKPLT